MQYKVLSASLGRDGKIYKQGTYIEIESEKEAEELSSFGCILIEKAKEVEELEKVKDVEKVIAVKLQGRKPYRGVKHVMDPLKVPDTGVIKGKKKEVNKK